MLTHSETTFDPEFSDEDVEAVVAWQQDQASRCSGCGHPRDETFTPDAEGAYEATPLKCHACAARDAAREEWRSNRAGLYFPVAPRPGWPPSEVN